MGLFHTYKHTHTQQAHTADFKALVFLSDLQTPEQAECVSLWYASTCMCVFICACKITREPTSMSENWLTLKFGTESSHLIFHFDKFNWL